MDWIALAADFLRADKKGVPNDRSSEIGGVSEVPTKLTKPLPDCDQRAEQRRFDPPKVPTKLTKLPSGGVVSVLSVLSERDEFEDRVVCTDCRNFRHGHCEQHTRAFLSSPIVGPELARLPQRCPAFKVKTPPHPFSNPPLPDPTPGAPPPNPIRDSYTGVTY